MIFVLSILFCTMTTATVAFTSSSSRSCNNNNGNNSNFNSKITRQTEAQLSPSSQQRSRSTSYSSSALSFSADIREITRAVTVLSYVAIDTPAFFPKMKISKLKLKYVQVIGLIGIIGIHILLLDVQIEEMAIELFLLFFSMKPIIRSMKLLRVISAVRCNEDGCTIDFDDLDDEDGIDNLNENNKDNDTSVGIGDGIGIGGITRRE